MAIFKEMLNKLAQHLLYPYSPDLIEKRFIRYFNIASGILIAITLVAIIPFEVDWPQNDFALVYEIPFVLAIFFSFFHMFILPVAAIYFLIRGKIRSAGLYFFAALFFLVFFMTLDNWDRF